MSGLADRRRNLGPVDFQSVELPRTAPADSGRGLRPVFVRQGVAMQSSGSSYIEVGGAKILATVNGPLQLRGDFEPRAEVDVSVHIEDFAGVSDKEGKQDFIADFVKTTVLPAIILDEIPKSVLQICIRVLSGDGNAAQTAACANAAVLALVNAGIVLHDVVTAVSVSQVGSELLVDADLPEGTENLTQLIAAYRPSTNKLVSLQLTSAQAVSRETVRGLLDSAVPAAVQLRDAFAAQLLEDYVKQR